MAYSKVLNRPMFNKHNSAYGRGIASNLVSDEERQRFNYGGRVGYNGGGFGEVLYDQSEFVLPGTSSFSGMRGIGSGYGPSRKRKKAELLKQELEGMDKSPQDIFYEKELEEARLGTSDKYKTGKEGIGLIEKEVEIDEPNGDLPHDPDSDQLYTDEEKKEKRSQMMLSMAERLIGGSRDKWGSTAQMKNIAGAVGDIRKIADPSERREMLAKYKAWGKAQADRDLAGLEAAQKINTSEATLLNKHIEQPLSFKVSEILKIKNVSRKPPVVAGKVPKPGNPTKEIDGMVLDITKLEKGVLYPDPNDPESFIVVDKQGTPQRLSSTTDIIEARTNKLIE